MTKRNPTVRGKRPSPAGPGGAAATALTPKEVLGMLRRHVWLLAFVTILGAVIGTGGWVLIRRDRPLYKAETFIKTVIAFIARIYPAMVIVYAGFTVWLTMVISNSARPPQHTPMARYNSRSAGCCMVNGGTWKTAAPCQQARLTRVPVTAAMTRLLRETASISRSKISMTKSVPAIGA